MFSDIHLGKMNSDEVEQRIIKMTSNIISRPETIVNLVCLGDLVETLAK
jgi:metallophosphoesterase superfamily enzyme